MIRVIAPRKRRSGIGFFAFFGLGSTSSAGLACGFAGAGSGSVRKARLGIRGSAGDSAWVQLCQAEESEASLS